MTRTPPFKDASKHQPPAFQPTHRSASHASPASQPAVHPAAQSAAPSRLNPSARPFQLTCPGYYTWQPVYYTGHIEPTYPYQQPRYLNPGGVPFDLQQAVPRGETAVQSSAGATQQQRREMGVNKQCVKPGQTSRRSGTRPQSAARDFTPRPTQRKDAYRNRLAKTPSASPILATSPSKLARSATAKPPPSPPTAKPPQPPTKEPLPPHTPWANFTAHIRADDATMSSRARAEREKLGTAFRPEMRETYRDRAGGRAERVHARISNLTPLADVQFQGKEGDVGGGDADEGGVQL